MILLNINMPRMNGFQVLEYLKGNDSFRSVPVVIFTTSSDPRERRRALGLGAEEYITKRGTFDALVEDLSRVCARFLSTSHTRSLDKGFPARASSEGAK
jgi:DNA-binding NarL/FixJ family response regulator